MGSHAAGEYRPRRLRRGCMEERWQEQMALAAKWRQAIAERRWEDARKAAQRAYDLARAITPKGP